MIAIKDLRIGDKAMIRGFRDCARQYRQKLLSMGLTPGAIIQLIRVAPLGDPIQILSRGCHVSLRKAEANVLQLEKVSI